MRTKTINGKYRFTYPNYGTPDGYPDYTAHSGQVVTIIRKLTPEESDNVMYEIEAEDGWRGHADAYELRSVKTQVRKLKQGDQVVIRLWTKTQAAEWKHKVASIGKSIATLDNGDKVSVIVGDKGLLTLIKAPPLVSEALYGQSLVKRTYTLKR